MTEERNNKWDQLEEKDVSPKEETETKESDSVLPDGVGHTPPAARWREWILSAVLVAAAYLYLSAFGFPTKLGEWIWSMRNYMDISRLTGVLWGVFAGIFLAAGLGYAKALGRRPSKESRIYLALTVAAALWFVFCLNEKQDIAFFMGIYLHGAAVYWLLTMTGNRSENYLNEKAVMDLGRGFVTLPFGGYLRIFREWADLAGWLMAGGRKEAGRSLTRQVLLGVLISIPVLCLVVPVLMAADGYFDALAGRALAGILAFFDNLNPFTWCVSAFFTMVIGCYLYGLFYNVFHKPAAGTAVKRQISSGFLGGFLVPLIVLYAVFFLIRMIGMSGAFNQIAAGTLSVSTYAREGFFDLCWLAAINFAMFSVCRWYRPEGSRLTRILLSILGAETIAFIVLAFSKMGYYIAMYSFTFKRVMCCWFLLTMLVLFALMIAELWKSFRGVRIGVLFGCVTFLMLAYSNLPAWAP